jgi:aspartate/methionine/tyrosine aminotransferase
VDQQLAIGDIGLKPAGQLKLIDKLVSIVYSGISGYADSIGVVELRQALVDRLRRRSERRTAESNDTSSPDFYSIGASVRLGTGHPAQLEIAHRPAVKSEDSADPAQSICPVRGLSAV